MSNPVSRTRKLRLDTDALHVESFAIGSETALRGTVRAHATEFGPCTMECTVTCPSDFGCTTGGGGTNTRVVSCRAADCTHVD